MKRKIFPIVCLALALALSIGLAACDKPETFKVTADYASGQGSVVISDADGNVKSTFKKDEQAVVAVTAASEYSVDSFKVNDEDAQLDGDGKYTFGVSKNTVIKVAFKKNGGGSPSSPLPTDALDSVKTTFKVTGSYVYQAEGQSPDINNITTVFGASTVNLIETAADGKIIYDDVYVDVDGKLAIPYHTLDNKIAYLYPSEGELFEEYSNPFKALGADDFASTDEDNVYEFIADADKRKSAATAITGYNESIASFKVTVEDGKVTGIDIVTERIKRGGVDGDFYYTSTYSLSVSDWDEAEVDAEKTAPYERTDAHIALADALAAAYSAENYTVNVYEVEPYSSYDDVEYDTYVTDTAIYYACDGWEEGYVEMGDTSKVVYPFGYNPETGVATLYDAARSFPTLRSMRASFNAFNDFAPEIFKYQTNADGTVTYFLYDDVDKPDNVRSILLSFADGLDVMRLYAGYTYDMSITLKDGALYQVMLDYLVGDAYVIRLLTYSAFDSTVMPITFDKCEKVSVLDDYVGTYTDGNITAVIDKNGIEINGLNFVITDYDIQYDIFTGDWSGGEWYISKTSEKQIVLLSIEEDVSYVLTSTELEPVDIPEAFEGVWSKDGHKLAIAYDKIEFDGAMLKVLSYGEEDGLYAIGGDYTYLFLLRELDGEPVVWITVYREGLSNTGYVLHKDDEAVILPEIFIGTWEKYDDYYHKNIKAVIGLTTVALEFGNDKPAVTLVNATFVTNYWELTLDVDGVEYSLAEGSFSADQIEIYSSEDKFIITLNRVEESEVQPPAPSGIPESFFGTFSGENGDIVYVVTINANGLSVKIGDGDAIAVSDFEYDDGELSFFIDTVQYGIFNYDYEDGVDSLTFYSYEGLYIEELSRVN